MPSKAAHRRLRIYGHRGDRRRALENTLESFSIALGDGADGIETDVRRLADGTLVLFHDDEIGGTPVELFTFAELSVAWPGAVKLESLRELHGHGELILEVKRRGYARELVDAVSDLDRVVIASFDHRLVAELAALREEFSASFELGVTIAGNMVGGARYTRDLGARWLFPAHTFVELRARQRVRRSRVEGGPLDPELGAVVGVLPELGLPRRHHRRAGRCGGVAGDG